MLEAGKRSLGKGGSGFIRVFLSYGFSLPIFKTHDNFFFRGKGKGELRIDAKFTSSKALMSAYLQEVPNTPVSINHSLLHITLTLNLIWWAIFLTIPQSLGDLATAQYRVPAYFPSHSDCQVFAIFIKITFLSIEHNLCWTLLLRGLFVGQFPTLSVEKAMIA